MIFFRIVKALLIILNSLHNYLMRPKNGYHFK